MESYASDRTVSLGGRWRFALDPADEGVADRWFESDLDGDILLPGTTNQRGKGSGQGRDWAGADPLVLSDASSDGGRTTGSVGRTREHLAERYPYEGAAWYQREVTVPPSWADRRVTLTFERTRQTTVWVDGVRVGSNESLSTSQEYDLTDVVDPGERTLTVRVDNDVAPLTYPGVQRSHMATEHTQTNWNGIVGDIELEATDPVWIDDVRVEPRPADSAVTVRVAVCNRTDDRANGQLDFRSRVIDGEYTAPHETRAVTVDGDRAVVDVDYDLGVDPPTWDEFDPARLGITVSLVARADGEDYVDGQPTTVGLRRVHTDGTQLALNDTTTMLRGTVDSCVFPETGYAPTDRDTWHDRLSTVREYGFNHVRFHSWCPPEAAFDVADELGLYLQPELPLWNNGGAFEDDEAADFYRAEARRILDAYGNHPSFVLFSLGNELAGDTDAMADFLTALREQDDRRLYTAGAYNGLSDGTYSECDDVWITATVPEPADTDDSTAESDTDADEDAGDDDIRRIRGTSGHIEREPPGTDHDYADAVASVPVPLVSHEGGQFQIYPDFTELQKYDGALRPDNLAVARDHLEAHGMAGRAAEFADATGQLALRCYREEVESALRTPGFGGFQLLALQDFPGQGTALVGLLDSFMDSKGVIDPAEWRSYCGETVPLVRLDRRTWTTDDALTAAVQLAHYGPEPLDAVAAEWDLSVAGVTVNSGSLAATNVPQGTLADLGTVETGLSGVEAPTSATLSVTIPVVDAVTTYDLWVYPPDAPRPDAPLPHDGDGDGVTVRRHFDAGTRDLLEDGAGVLLVPPPESVAHSYEAQFQPSFWSYALFKRNAPPGTMGPVFDADHPALDRFPTESHGDWQWWHLLDSARAVSLDDAPDDYRPIVGMVDNIERNHKLGLVFETAVGDGNLLVSTVDLFDCADHPAGRQFYASLAAYCRSDAFDPDSDLSEAVLARLLPE